MRVGAKLPSARALAAVTPVASKATAPSEAPLTDIDTASMLRRAVALGAARSAYPNFLRGLDDARGYRAVDRQRALPAVPAKQNHSWENSLPQSLLPDAAAGVVQRVITFTKYETGKDSYDENRAMEPGEFCAAIRKTNAYQALALVCKNNGVSGDKEIEEQIIEWLRLNADGQVIGSRNEFLKQLERGKQKFAEFLEKGGGKEVEIRKEQDLSGDVLLNLLDRAAGREVLHKLSVVRTVDPKVVNLLVRLASKLPKGVKEGLLSQEEVELLFQKLTGIQRHENVVEEVEGYIVSCQGIVGELSGLLEVLKAGDVAKGERIFSGSTFSAKGQQKLSHKQEVDVSYIDKEGTLHLIEAANSLNVLKNKVLSSSDQKKNYSYLSNQATELEHEAVGGFTDQQARNQAVSDVRFSYVIPNDEILDILKTNEDFSLDMLKELDEILRALVGAKAWLRIGLKGIRYSPSHLAEWRNECLQLIKKREELLKANKHLLSELAGLDSDELSPNERVKKAILQTQNLNLMFGRKFGQ